MLTAWRGKRAWAAASTPSCKHAFSPSAAFCPGGGHRGHQAGHPGNLREARRSRGPEEFCGRRSGAIPPPSVKVPEKVSAAFDVLPPVPARAPAFVREVVGTIIAGNGDALPVSALPIDGTFPTATAQWEKRNIAQQIPVWDAELCIQCGKCVMVCPHAVIRAKVYDSLLLSNAPPTFKTAQPCWREFASLRYTLQVAPEDCTGCRLCVEICPAKSKSEVKHKAINMEMQAPLRQQESANWEFFLSLPEFDRERISHTQVKDTQLLEPLFEFSGACAGCGETPYIKLLTQLFGDRLLIANATGCSSIYGGNLPTTPYTVNREGRGPAWSNSLFEDNAEFGLGMRLAMDQQAVFAHHLLTQLSGSLGGVLASDGFARSRSVEGSRNQSPAPARRRAERQARGHRFGGGPRASRRR